MHCLRTDNKLYFVDTLEEKKKERKEVIKKKKKLVDHFQFGFQLTNFFFFFLPSDFKDQLPICLTHAFYQSLNTLSLLP